MKALPFQIRNDFKSFSKPVLLDSNKREAMFCFGKLNWVSKSLDWNHSKKGVCFVLENKDLQKNYFQNLHWFQPFSKIRSTLDFNSFASHPPSLFKQGFKTTCLEKFGICKTSSSKWFQTPHTHYFGASFVQNTCLEKFIKSKLL